MRRVLARIAANPELQPKGSTDWGVIVVTYTRADRSQLGFASVPVVIVDAPPR